MSVYAITTNTFLTLPSAGWQLRERRIWKFTLDDVAGATQRQEGRVRELVRKGDHAWAIAPGSQGVIEDAAVEETLLGLIEMPVDAWVGIGDQTRSRCGFNDRCLQLTVELKNGAKNSMEFGGHDASGNPCGAVQLDGQTWVFEIPRLLYRDVQLYLSVPPGP